MSHNFQKLLISCFLFGVTSCIEKPNKSLLNLVLLNTIQVITPGILISLDPAEGATVSNFSGSITATFRKPLSNVSNQTISNSSDCSRTEIKFLLYQTSPTTCIRGALSVSEDSRTLTFQTATTLSPGTYQIKIQNILDSNSNPVDYQSSSGFTISPSSTTTTITTTTPSVPTPTLSFANKLYQTFQGNAFPTPITATTNATITNCTITPALPAGLSINATTCSITGTPTAGGAGVQYTVTASTSSGTNISTTLKIKVIGPNAFRVYGQFGNFTCPIANNNGSCAAGTPSTNNLSAPWGIAVDQNDNVYISDRNNSRILFYSPGSTTASRVYGQFGSFSCNSFNNNGSCITVTPSTDNLSSPTGVGLDSSGNVYIVDQANNRVLRFSGSSTTANYVWGQGGAANFTANSSSTATDGFNSPFAVSFDPSNNMYITENSNNRVLVYGSGAPTPNFLFGQPTGNYSVATANNTSINVACNTAVNCAGISSPIATIADNNNVYVADSFNNRVLIFPVGNNVATRVLGQANFTTGGAGCGPTTMKNPAGFTFDVNGNLYVLGNAFGGGGSQGRILVYTPPFTNGMKANFVIGGGQTTLANFTSCLSGTTANTFSPQTRGNMAFDSFGNLYFTDEANNRALVF